MQYRFTADQDWSDFSSGRVFRSRPGQTAFPARLANEMFRMCIDVCERNGKFGPYAVYDPCCGGATLLAEIALLNPQRIWQMVGSDVDGQALETARDNLALLTPEGANERLLRIDADYRAYGKESHKQALASARRIRDQVALDREQSPLSTALLLLDASRLSIGDCHSIGQPDIVLSDVPYGIQSRWKVSPHPSSTPIHLLLQSMLLLPGKPVVAIAADKKSRVEHEQYRRLKRLSAGKRQIVLLSAI